MLLQNNFIASQTGSWQGREWLRFFLRLPAVTRHRLERARLACIQAGSQPIPARMYTDPRDYMDDMFTQRCFKVNVQCLANTMFLSTQALQGM